MFKSQPNSSAEERNVRLMHHLNITATDIATNRQGKLTDQQRTELTQMAQQSSPAILMMGFITLIVTIVIIVVQLNTEGILDNFDEQTIFIPIIGLGGSFLLYTILLIYATWRGWKNRDRPIDDMEIKSIEGKVKLIDTSTHWIILKIRRKRIYILNPNADKAIVSGTPYNVFYLTNSYNMGYFLSAVAID